MERYVCLQPEYVSRFRCDGTRCRSKCCRDWGVNLDGASLKRYRDIADVAVREGILSHVRQGNGSVYFELRENGWCPFLREDYLCRLQKELGEGYLSCTCRTFPRMVYLVGSMLERSLSLACPVAAELILSGTEPMCFEQVEVDIEEPIVVRHPQDSRALEGLQEIQYAGISLLQDRRFSLDGRLALLGSFLEQAQAMADAGCMETVGRLAEFYTTDALMCHAHKLLQAVRFRPTRFAEEIKSLGENIHARESKLSIADLNLTRFLEALDGKTVGFFAGMYGGAYAAIRTEMLERHGRMLEHYLVNEFFLNIYPFRIKGTLLQNFHAFVMGYKLLECMLLVFYEQGGGMTEQLLTDALTDFAYRMDHGSSHMENITRKALERECTLAILLNGLLQTSESCDGVEITS